jgi:DNA-binding IclR family transcriptional regulator
VKSKVARDIALEKDGTSTQQVYTIHVLAKALDLLELLGSNGSALGLAEICQRLNLPKSSVFRYLATLEHRGFVKRNPDTNQYRLGLKLLELGNVVVSQFDVREAALPVMRGLHDLAEETVNLAVIDNYQVVYIEVLEGKSHSVRIVGQPGQRQLAHSTAVGKAILAYMPQAEVDALVRRHGLPAFTTKTITTTEALQADLAGVRARGYAMDEEESDAGVRCVGVPIFDHHGGVVAGISISAPIDRMAPARLEKIRRELVAGAATISRQLGYRKLP